MDTQHPEEFNLERVKQDFRKGREFVDAGAYKQAMDIYTNLIQGNEKFKGQSMADFYQEVSYTNNGIAKCKLAVEKKDKSLLRRWAGRFSKIDCHEQRW